jgi:hypothetical protein
MTTTNQRAVELAPCPFCGGAATMYEPTCNKSTPYNAADRAFPVVRCACGVQVNGENWDQSGHSALTAWNRRAPGWRPISEEQVEAAAISICSVRNSITLDGARLEWPHMTDHSKDGYRRMARAALSTLPPPPGEG